MLDGARPIALQARVHWLRYCIFVLQQATPNTKRATLEMSSFYNETIFAVCSVAIQSGRRIKAA